MMRRALAFMIGLAGALFSSGVEAQYRLRADAYYAAPDPTTGLLVLQGESHRPSWLDAEAVVWLGATTVAGPAAQPYPADVLVASVRARHPDGYGEARVGRMLLTAGGLRPVHLDGADVIGRAPWGTSIEAFGGVPVAPAYQSRDFDWAVGGRLAQRIGTYGTVGLAYLQLRDTGAKAYEELGFDATATPARYLDAAFSGAVDLQGLVLSDARISLATRFAGVRIELFAARRSPSHLLPATSLFSALGDVPSQRAGGTMLWRAAPRLDILGEGAAESLAGELAYQLLFRSTLRLDDRGDGALGLEARRQGTPGDAWMGVRATARLPLTRLLSAAAELELVRPDVARGRGALWPWGLVAMRLKPEPGWELAGAVEASASPAAVSEVNVIFRVSRAWAAR
ncbi:Hypothetical protein A7982_00748 [Minicystis rosea]|nr:Hypothetical protein A7982_00748 [Minicystis rosea]